MKHYRVKDRTTGTTEIMTGYDVIEVHGIGASRRLACLEAGDVVALDSRGDVTATVHRPWFAWSRIKTILIWCAYFLTGAVTLMCGFEFGGGL